MPWTSRLRPPSAFWSPACPATRVETPIAALSWLSCTSSRWLGVSTNRDLCSPNGGGRTVRSARTLLDATILIVGLGAIGTALARRLAPFGPRLLGIRARPGLAGPPEVELVRGPERLHELLPHADAVMCCAELHEGNGRMFGPDEFAAMKQGALFVNVARGGLVDERALLAALDSGWLGGAGLDVFAREPPDLDSPLAGHSRVIATPHVGWHTGYMFRQTSEVFAANLRRYGAGEDPLWTVNEPAFRRGRIAARAWQPGDAG
jgi:phosphoglycerate dehydrogenase-like enzyme